MPADIVHPLVVWISGTIIAAGFIGLWLWGKNKMAKILENVEQIPNLNRDLRDHMQDEEDKLVRQQQALDERLREGNRRMLALESSHDVLRASQARIEGTLDVVLDSLGVGKHSRS